MPDSALSTLLSLACHELRGPTGVIRGYLKMLEQDPSLAERPRRVIGDATRAADRLAALLDEVAALARFKEGASPLTLRSRSLRSVLAEAAQSVALPANHDVRLEVVAPVDVRMRLDDARLRSVFETLIVTFARAQAGSTAIDLRLIKGRASTSVIVAPRTLGRGTVVNRPPDLSRGGTGLQLPIADAVVHAHGGRLRERWIAGRWAGFVVRLA